MLKYFVLMIVLMSSSIVSLQLEQIELGLTLAFLAAIPTGIALEVLTRKS